MIYYYSLKKNVYIFSIIKIVIDFIHKNIEYIFTLKKIVHRILQK